VSTSARVSSENPAARSLRKGSRSVDDKQLVWLWRDGCAARLPEEPSGVIESSSGKNSAGPSGLLTSAFGKTITHPSGWGNIEGSSNVIPI